MNLTLPPCGVPPPTLFINEGGDEHDGAYAEKCLARWRLADLPLDDAARASS